MNELAKKATLLGIFGNIILFILKIVVGFLYNSIAVISSSVKFKITKTYLIKDTTWHFFISFNPNSLNIEFPPPKLP